MPIPLVPPCTRKTSPACRCIRSKTLVQTVEKASGRPPASIRLTPSGTGSHCTAGAAAYSPYPSPIISAQTWSPTCHCETTSTVFTTVPEHSRPGKSGAAAAGSVRYPPDWREDMSILQDRIVLVTGAGAGIGRATAVAMAEVGATVAAADIDLAAAQRTADQTAGNTRRAIAIEADCGDVASIDAMVARTVAELGRLDVIVNNAGVTRYAQIMDLTEADWDRIHRVNAKGVFFCLQRAAREMIRQHQADGSGGRIINIASISGRGYPGASNAAYAASKGAVISLIW